MLLGSTGAGMGIYKLGDARPRNQVLPGLFSQVYPLFGRKLFLDSLTNPTPEKESIYEANSLQLT